MIVVYCVLGLFTAFCLLGAILDATGYEPETPENEQSTSEPTSDNTTGGAGGAATEEPTDSAETSAPDTEPTTAAAAEPEPTEESDTGEDTSVHYENCDAARDAGAAPVYAGDPGYGDHLDRDGDGVACE